MAPKDEKRSATMIDAEQREQLNSNNIDNEDDQEEESDEEEERDILVDMPAYLLRRLDQLKVLDQDRDSHMVGYLKERAALEAKYNTMFAKLYDERKQIVLGEKDVELAAAASEEEKNEENEKRVKGVPQFWVCAMAHMETIGALFAEEDVDCLEYLQDVTCEDDTDGRGFTLSFYFATNPYFENDILTKKYEIPNLLMGGDPVLKNVAGSEIKWKENRSLTHTTVVKKQRGKGQHAGQVRSVTKQERKESFFHWFEPPMMPSLEDMNEEKAANLEALFDMDYEIAQSFRSQIIPKAVLWFTGEAAQPDLEEAVDELLLGQTS